MTNKGRIDITCFIEDKIYIIELKVIKSEKGSATFTIREKIL